MIARIIVKRAQLEQDGRLGGPIAALVGQDEPLSLCDHVGDGHGSLRIGSRGLGDDGIHEICHGSRLCCELECPLALGIDNEQRCQQADADNRCCAQAQPMTLYELEGVI